MRHRLPAVPPEITLVAPFAGTVVSLPGAMTTTVSAGTTVAVIEAMKMESAVTAGTAGTGEAVHVLDKAQVEPGDLVVVLSPAPPACAPRRWLAFAHDRAEGP